MDPWTILFLQLAIFAVLIPGTIVSIIFLIKRILRKEKKYSVIISFVINIVFLTVLYVFSCSRGTYYKYNDWSIIGKDIHAIEQKYGEFDLGQIKDQQSGTVAYYIYTDNGIIMPDHLKHYYYIEYNETGIVYKVYDACQPGG